MSVDVKRGLWIVAAVLLVAAPLVIAAAETVNVTGTWDVTWEGRQGPRTVTINFTQEGEKLTGTYAGPGGQEFPVNGTVKGDTIEFSVAVHSQRGEFTLTFKGTVAGESMKGTMSTGQQGEREWTGKKTG